MKFLNLIPIIQKNRLNREKRFLLIHGALGFVVFIIATSGIFLMIARDMLINHYNSLKQNTSLVNSGVIILQNNITSVNKKVENIEKIQSSFSKTSQILNNLTLVMPKDVTLNYLNFELKNGTFKINGVAENREALMQAKTNLENSYFVSSFNSPLSNFLEKENIEFKFSGAIKKELFSSPQK